MMRISKNRLSQILASSAGRNARLYAFAAFMTLVFFLGGGSRDDVQSLVILRPLAVLFGGYALICGSREQWKGRLFPLYIAGALLVVMILQLIPLPPSIWTELPGRKIFADIADLAGIEQPWRSLTLAPSRTLNSLFSLSVPITAMMLYLNLDKEDRKKAISVVICLATVSALWAILQLAGPSRGPLYLYDITNNGAAVGLLSNRNHQSILLAATIAMLGWYAALSNPTERFAAVKFYGCISMIFLFVPLIFITGSRAGLILLAPAVIAATILLYVGRFNAHAMPVTKKVNRKKKFRLSTRQIIAFCVIAATITVAVLSVYFSRSLAFDRLFGSSEPNELRTQLTPTLFRMMTDYFPWGSGFGAFEHVYRIYEPQELLRPSYLNQAHNDWLQYPIEGGAASMLIGVAAIAWFFSKLAGIAINWRRSRYTKYTALTAAFVILCFAAASLADYPLRVPSIIAVFGVMVCIFNDAVASIHAKQTKQK